MPPEPALPARPRPLAGAALPTFVVESPSEAGEAVAAEIAAGIAAATRAGRGYVLGLAGGRSPLFVYDALVRRRREEGLDLARVRTFALDEYLGLGPEHPASFQAGLRRALLDPAGLPAGSASFLDGTVAPAEAAAHCADYERRIAAAGGIDLLLLGLGTNGHLAFDEPGSARDSRTRVVRLAEATQRTNRAAFPPGEEVPERALTMGVATILEARRLRVLAFGAHKAVAVRRALADPIGPELPATFLRGHPDVELWLDRAAAAEL